MTSFLDGQFANIATQPKDVATSVADSAKNNFRFAKFNKESRFKEHTFEVYSSAE